MALRDLLNLPDFTQAISCPDCAVYQLAGGLARFTRPLTGTKPAQWLMGADGSQYQHIGNFPASDPL